MEVQFPGSRQQCCRPAAALTLGMFATWVSTIVAVLVILVKSLLGAKAKRA